DFDGVRPRIGGKRGIEARRADLDSVPLDHRTGRRRLSPANTELRKARFERARVLLRHRVALVGLIRAKRVDEIAPAEPRARRFSRMLLAVGEIEERSRRRIQPLTL